MASIHVIIELQGGRPIQASLEALGVGRRLASYLGATLNAVVVGDPTGPLRAAIPPDLGRHGADRVLWAASREASEPLLFSGHGRALAAVCDMIPPALVLLSATPGGRDVASRLAARLGGVFVDEPSMAYGSHGDLLLCRMSRGGTPGAAFSTEGLGRTIVAALTPHASPKALGDRDPEVIVIPAPQGPPAFAEVDRAIDPGAALDDARVVLGAGAGVTPATFAILRDLARVLGAEIAVTPNAAAAGLGDRGHIVDLGVRRLQPRLYIACAASGSAAHLAAVSPQARIVAINRDPAAPIFQAADYGLVGDLEAVLPRLVRALGAAS